MARPFYNAPSSYSKYQATLPLSGSISSFRHPPPFPARAPSHSTVSECSPVYRPSEQIRPAYSCQQCDRHFSRQGALDAHLSEHAPCPYSDCTFTAHRSVVDQHVRMHHETGLADAIMALNTPEAIAKWREQRRRRFATVDQAETSRRRRAEQQAAASTTRRGVATGKKGVRRDRWSTQPVWKIQQRREQHDQRRLRVALEDSSDEDDVVKTSSLPMFTGLSSLASHRSTAADCHGGDHSLESPAITLRAVSISRQITGAGIDALESTFSTNQPNEPTLSTNLPNQPTLSTNLPNQPTLSTNLPNQPTLSTNLPNQPTLSTNLPNQPTLSTNLPNQPTLYTNLPNQHTLSTNLPNQPTLSTNLPNQPTLSTNLPNQPTLSTNLPNQPTLPTNLPSQSPYSTIEYDPPSHVTGKSDTPSHVTGESDSPSHVTAESDPPLHVTGESDPRPHVSGELARRELANHNAPGKRRRQRRSNPGLSVARCSPGVNNRQPAPRRGCRSRATLLEKLLATDVRREQSILLQCVRHVVDQNFFLDGKCSRENSIGVAGGNWRNIGDFSEHTRRSREILNKSESFKTCEKNTNISSSSSVAGVGALHLLSSYNSDSDQASD